MQVVVPKVEKIANFGTSEPFVARIVLGLSEVIDVTTYENKDAIKEAIMEMFMNGLAPAFHSLQGLRKMYLNTQEALLMDLRKEYFSFYDRIWAAYKDRMQQVIGHLGYNMGFLFLKDEMFEKKAEEFFAQHVEV